MVERPTAKIVPDPVPESLKLKVVVVGDQGIGKSCMLKRYASNTYNAEEEKTIGSDFYTK